MASEPLHFPDSVSEEVRPRRPEAREDSHSTNVGCRFREFDSTEKIEEPENRI
jgi:hypothetical protein